MTKATVHLPLSLLHDTGKLDRYVNCDFSYFVWLRVSSKMYNTYVGLYSQFTIKSLPNRKFFFFIKSALRLNPNKFLRPKLFRSVLLLKKYPRLKEGVQSVLLCMK
jgi:hypothetical protein